MAPKLYKHFCLICGHSYLAYDKDKIFCSSDCEARKSWEDKHPKAVRIRQERKLEEDRKKKPKEPVNEAKRFLNKKPQSNTRDSQYIMYRDTFKKFFPKSLKVMRG